jgi:hypothetical protein
MAVDPEKQTERDEERPAPDEQSERDEKLDEAERKAEETRRRPGSARGHRELVPWRRATSETGVSAARRRNLLVVLLADAEAQLRRAVADRAGGPVAFRVVAAARVGALEWLATDAADARRQPTCALAAEWTLHDRARVGGEAGDADPVQAVEDALREFRADEILIVGGRAGRGRSDFSAKSDKGMRRAPGAGGCCVYCSCCADYGARLG